MVSVLAMQLFLKLATGTRGQKKLDMGLLWALQASFWLWEVVLGLPECIEG